MVVASSFAIAAPAASASALLADAASFSIAARVVARSAAISSCSWSKPSMVAWSTPTAFSPAQAISCSPSWWSVSWASKFSHARCSAAARALSPSENFSSAVLNRLRSRRTAQWITLFMLMLGAAMRPA